MFSIFKKYDIGIFEYLYMFVMVIYMGQMTPETSRMVGTISGDPIPFLIPIVLTVWLIIKHHISFSHKEFIMVLVVLSTWAILVIEKYQSFANEELSHYFFFFYSIIVAFIQIQVFGKKLLPLYEDILVKLSFISLLLWGYALFNPMASFFFKQFEETSYGNNFFYIFNWMDPYKGQYYEGIIRNAGFSWEPGRFSICVVLALFCNIARTGLSTNTNKIILLTTVASTLSTTGYTAASVIYIISFTHKLTLQKTLLFFIILVPSLYGISKLGFMKNKIEEQIKVETNLKQLEETFHYNSEATAEGEYVASLERFTAIYFEWENVMNDPILGYGRNPNNSNFYNNVSTNFVLTGGLVKLLGQHGIPIGIFIYLLLLFSSFKIHKDFNKMSALGLFFTFLVSSISYVIFYIPVFTAFWFYGVFYKKEDVEKPTEKQSSQALMNRFRKKYQECI